MANMPTARVVLRVGEGGGALVGSGVSGKSQRDAVCPAWGQHKALYVAAITRQQQQQHLLSSSLAECGKIRLSWTRCFKCDAETRISHHIEFWNNVKISNN